MGSQSEAMFLIFNVIHKAITLLYYFKSGVMGGTSACFGQEENQDQC